MPLVRLQTLEIKKTRASEGQFTSVLDSKSNP
jgi:hypothetical protein